MQQIGRYQILEEIGRGAMGVVYRALDPSIGRTVAVKTFRVSDVPDQNERTRLRDRIMREAQSAGVLSHPNLVTIFDMAEEGDLAYLAMEYVDGPTLDHLFHTTKLTGKQILDLLKQTAAALDYAHKRGIVHRDIKPANIMLQDGSVVKIADFGVARIQSQQATLAGTIIGTPNYMSPEQIQGHAIDGRADQFSLAVIAYELLTGEKPFAAESMPTLLFKIVREDPAPPQRLNPTLGWPVETVLSRALAKDPAERYQSCSDFVRALENACASSKGWTPLPPGESHDLPTVMERPAVEPVVAPVPAGAATPLTAPVDAAPERVPLLLRLARGLAVVIFGGGLVSVLLVFGFRYFGEKEQAENLPSAPIDQTIEAPKKSPMPKEPPPPVEEPKAAEPKAAEEKPAEEPPAKATTKPAVTSVPVQTGGTVSSRLVTIPPGATLVVDGRSDLTCTTPCGLTLPPGRHTLTATLAGHRSALKIFEVPRDSELYINLEATTGTLVLRSDPPGATIVIDGQTRPEHTPVTLTLPSGSHRVELSKEGFKTYTEELELKDATITNVDINWNSKRGSL
jgi:tRNA A-37 threonylcarbamoyl transferase component Bud32